MICDEQKRPWFFCLLISILIVSLIGSIFLFVALKVHGIGAITVYWLTFGIPIISLILMTWRGSLYAVQYDDKNFTFGYLGRKVKLSNSELMSAKHVDIKWIKWSGMGWRIRGCKYI